ncbi:MAG: hypothetical protein HKO59_08845 [Phycisphaerales bacterium]|nr:hypothetical protein [Phycisphaerae bacterium]NNF42465.1 hypothetical protein [Phycisphaerales bacterium]NNM26076.1 hypothetical protein [Phycisphaerales bacterium]
MNPAWTNETTLHPIGLAAVLLLGVAMLLVPRRHAVIPMLLLACFIAPAQRVVVATLDFNLLRLLVLFGWVRVLIYGETLGFRWKPIDAVVIAWTIAGTMAMTLQTTAMATLVNRLGVAFDAIGMYFLFRLLVRDWEDVLIIARWTALLSFPVACVFLVEHTTGRNMFSIFGGVPEVTMIRQGRLRCQGPFTHPIIAGAFWAVLLPLIATLWHDRGHFRWLCVPAMAACVTVVATTASSTPLSALIAAAFAGAMFPLRRWLGWIHAMGIFGLIVLQAVMNNPIWYLVARVDLVAGSTGWYRYKLIDLTVQHFEEWWLIGTPHYASWWRYGGSDLTNEYVRQALHGGLLTLLLFAGIILVAFRDAGRIRRTASDQHRVITGWALGSMLFVHCVVFIAVAYFGQINMIWYLTLAMIASLAPVRSSHRGRWARPAAHAGPGTGTRRLVSTFGGAR